LQQAAVCSGNHAFAWPQQQFATLWVDNDASVLRPFGEQVRRSLLRLTPIRLHVRLLNGSRVLVCLEVFAVPNVRAIRLQPVPSAGHAHAMALHFLCPLLCRPAAQQLITLDLSRLWHHQSSIAEWRQLCALRQLRSLSLGSVLGKDRLYVLKDLALVLPDLRQYDLCASLSRGTRLISLGLTDSVVHARFAQCLAELPSLQRVRLSRGEVKEQADSPWAALRSLHELQLTDVSRIELLLPFLSSVPALRLLRWRCNAPCVILQSHASSTPSVLLEPLSQLLTSAPLLQVELLLPLTFDKWQQGTGSVGNMELCTVQQRLSDELHQLPAQLPRGRTRVVELQPEDEE
jgi:hypothetical protein